MTISEDLASYGTLGVAIVINEVIEPVRLPVVLLTTPWVAPVLSPVVDPIADKLYQYWYKKKTDGAKVDESSDEVSNVDDEKGSRPGKKEDLSLK